MTAVAVTTDLQRGINTAVGELDRWLDTMRGPRGYAGPLAHWWRQGFTWTAAALDWRYEGIIAGYIQLWRCTVDGHWLAKAQWAADDLLAGQCPGGHFIHGAPERGPSSVGTPHEAACAAALLELALVLRESRSDVWQPYATAAELTIHAALIDELWDADRSIFRESPSSTAFLPHQMAAICEALFRQAELRQLASPVEEYALPALRAIMAQQIYAAGDPLDGAIAYRVDGTRRPNQYLPLCVARCIPALLQGYDWTGDARFYEAAWRAFAFLHRSQNEDGSFPAVVYPGGRSNQYPQWIAATGDVLRAAAALAARGTSTDVNATLHLLLDGQDRSGGVVTARGFGMRVLQRSTHLPDVRDVLHVVGWCDKAFRALALEASDVTPLHQPVSMERPCTFRGQLLTICEDESLVEIRRGREVRYRWHKGDDWPTICEPEFALL